MKSKNKKISLINGAGKILALVFIVLLAWYISAHHYQLMLIQGESMLPTYHPMQLVVLEKQSEEITHGDVIAFSCPELDALLVKRVAACPGGTVQIKGGTLLVNGVDSEVYSAGIYFEFAGIAETEIMLEDNEYFVIGDNVAESKDSRYEAVGIVKDEDIIGKVMQ